MTEGLLNSWRLLYRLKRLGRVGTVLHVAAHPDDEESGLLAYVSFKLLGRAVYWSATRGEGGQNNINQYRGKALGIFRTWESLSAREIDGGECLFGPFIDFGYSKNAREAFSKWGRENMIRELVRTIRMVQPQVVISRWNGTAEDVHGHHQAAGQAITEAFKEAGDPNRFPEMLKEGIAPWQPLKLYCSLKSTGMSISATTPGGNISGQLNPALEREGVLRINTGEYDPFLGCTFQELAWRAYNQHKSQGIGVSPSPGDFYYYFQLVESRVPVPDKETDPFNGIDPTLTGIAAGNGDLSPQMHEILEEIKTQVAKAEERFRPDSPLPSSTPLMRGLNRLRGLHRGLPRRKLTIPVKQALGFALNRKIREFEEVIAACLGLRLEALCTRGKVPPGESFWVSCRLLNPFQVKLEHASFRIQVPKDWHKEEAEDFTRETSPVKTAAQYEVFIGSDAELSCPYWLQKAEHRYLYPIPSGAPEIHQSPLDPASVYALCNIRIKGSELTLRSPVKHRIAFPGGYRQLPPAVIPPVSLHPEADKKFFLYSKSEIRSELKVTVRCNDEEQPAEGRLILTAPDSWPVAPEKIKVRLQPLGRAQTCKFSISMPGDLTEGQYLLRYEVQCRHRDYDAVMTPVRMAMPGLPHAEDGLTCIKEQILLEPAQTIVHIINAHFIKEHRYAYVEGVKEDILATLKTMGLEFHHLSNHEIAHGDLDSFNAIVIGPRAYTHREILPENNHRFLEYVEKGGTLIVQYQWYGYDKPGLAPYPFKYHRPMKRVTDENSQVTILKPDAPLFHFPNPISPRDFNDWVNDRGLAFFSEWDETYEDYLSCSDPGEEPLKGGLVGCRYGRGFYFYVAYSLFRQLPAGVPGAFRLFFNLLAAGAWDRKK